MKRSKPLRRLKPISPMSQKTKRLQSKRKAVREEVLHRDDNRCQAGIIGLCSFHATDVHEIIPRGRGGSAYDPDNCLSLCRSCHRYITLEPAWATAHGFMLPAWAGHAEMRAAERARVEYQKRSDPYLVYEDPDEA
jgi:HNH endonuclease